MKKSDFIFGYNPVIEAAETGKEIDKILILKGMQQIKASRIVGIARQLDIPIQFVPNEKLNSITGKNHQGVIALTSAVSYYKPEELLISTFESGRIPLFLFLDKITDVRNFGSIVRTAECGGVDGIIIPSKGSAQIGPDAIKTSAGALSHFPIARHPDLKTTIKYFRDSGVQVCAATEKANILHFEVDYKVPTAFIMGSEDIGIQPDILELCDTSIRIPMTGKTGSLNVSVAAGILVFEALRQRNSTSK
ncbi:MAG: 23S rRNA (guanosine(2251)-2'-O)-methyltransferase RlmB [Bacteroidales bacterium]|nr:23S rRNA (guanosine(2251)-2'-O)-methyltransferase RlmB [Bacteroidales bacterium]